MSAPPVVYKLAVCLNPHVTAMDYQGPVEVLGDFREMVRDAVGPGTPDIRFDTTYLFHSLDPLKPLSGPRILPDQTYDNAKEQFDILLVPGGPPGLIMHTSIVEFLKRQGPGAKYILTVCTGSWILAYSGLLDGKRATSNKFTFKLQEEDTKDLPITWVRKARWVVDGNIWSSSGVTAGMDMANAFLEHIIGQEYAAAVRSIIELSAKGEGDDEFAEILGLV